MGHTLRWCPAVDYWVPSDKRVEGQACPWCETTLPAPTGPTVTIGEPPMVVVCEFVPRELPRKQRDYLTDARRVEAHAMHLLLGAWDSARIEIDGQVVAAIRSSLERSGRVATVDRLMTKSVGF